MPNKWEEIAEGCLDGAIALLKNEIAPDAATAEAIRNLTETAITVDLHLLRIDRQTRCDAAVYSRQTLERRAKGNSVASCAE